MNSLVTSLNIFCLKNIKKIILFLSILSVRSKNKLESFIILCVILTVLKLSSVKNMINNFKNIFNFKKEEENIKIVCKKILNDDPYDNDKKLLHKQYNNPSDNNDFVLNVTHSTCGTPIFNLRTFKEIDFHFNFILHNFDTYKINNLIMCKDIHKWMTTSSLSNDDLSDELVPLYYIKKIGEETHVYEYLKIFINTDTDNIKTALVQKGCDYLTIIGDISELINKKFIKDLLDTKNYNNYNLSLHDDVYNFLDRLLSLVLIPEELIGEKIHLDIKNYYENKKTYEYNFNTVNEDINVFNTCL